MDFAKARERFEGHLEKAGLRVTRPRLAIFEAAAALRGHFTAEELLDHARAIDDVVSRATVYRTLPILTETGVLREVDIGKGIRFYTPGPADNAPAVPMAQVVCEDCSRIFEIGAPFLGWYAESVASKIGLEPTSQRLQVNARCRSWKNDGRCQYRQGAPAAARQ